MLSLYHICKQADKGNYDAGYIGATNNYLRRINEHASVYDDYNPVLSKAITENNDLISYEILQDEDELVLLAEATLRPSKNIGWNLAEGGGIPPSAKGIKRSEAFCKQISERQRGEKNWSYGKPAHNKGKIVNPLDYYSKNPTRRDAFQKVCKKRGLDFNSFNEEFAKWRIKPSGIRYRTYFYRRANHVV